MRWKAGAWTTEKPTIPAVALKAAGIASHQWQQSRAELVCYAAKASVPGTQSCLRVQVASALGRTCARVGSAVREAAEVEAEAGGGRTGSANEGADARTVEQEFGDWGSVRSTIRRAMAV